MNRRADVLVEGGGTHVCMCVAEELLLHAAAVSAHATAGYVSWLWVGADMERSAFLTAFWSAVLTSPVGSCTFWLAA